eukprot:COSAG01_NODE_2539_length_7485_cov_49.290650_2_plen_103_part_00
MNLPTQVWDALTGVAGVSSGAPILSIRTYVEVLLDDQVLDQLGIGGTSGHSGQEVTVWASPSRAQLNGRLLCVLYREIPVQSAAWNDEERRNQNGRAPPSSP